MIAKQQLPDWTPVENGHIYCSPACGMGCTKAAYEEAHQWAASAQKTLALTGMGHWEIDVWENLGWHWRLKNGPWFLHPMIDHGKIVKWSCYDYGDTGLSQVWVDNPSAAGAIVGVRNELRRIVKAAEEMLEVLKGPGGAGVI